ncbi:hypothetical protein NYE44_09225 [Paenibacillus sp. FSL L8-0493]|nr:hypothetical protein [Paenibacillus odorifer]
MDFLRKKTASADLKRQFVYDVITEIAGISGCFQLTKYAFRLYN